MEGQVTISLMEYHRLTDISQKMEEAIRDGTYSQITSRCSPYGDYTYIVNLTKDEFIEDLVTRMIELNERSKQRIKEITSLTAKEFKKKYK